jgi:delta(3,5)-delta(2,4)-dienoyl-CoA isomerase
MTVFATLLRKIHKDEWPGVQSEPGLSGYARSLVVSNFHGTLLTTHSPRWNAAMVLSDDVNKAMMSGIKKTKPKFEKL